MHVKTPLAGAALAIVACADPRLLLGPDCSDPGVCLDAGNGDGGSAGSGGAGGAGLECEPLTADCNADPSDACEVDIASNDRHCGACNADCGGGACSRGVCGPWLVVTGGYPMAVVPYGDQLAYVGQDYTSGEFAVRSVAKAGGVAILLATFASSGFPPRFTAGAGRACWLSTEHSPGPVMTASIGCVPLGGGAVSALANDFHSRGAGLAIDAGSTRAYFSVTCSTFGCSEAHLGFVPLDGSAAAQLVPGVSQDFGAVQVDAGHLYWSQAPDPFYDRSQPAAIMRAQLDGSSPGVVAVEQEAVDQLLLVAGRLYWRTGTAIWRVSADGGPVELVLDSPDLEPTGLVDKWTADTTGIYWIANTGLAIKKTDEQNQTSLAATVDNAIGIATDESYLYWTEPGGPDGGSIRAIRK
jgi:hypothetical protein